MKTTMSRFIMILTTLMLSTNLLAQNQDSFDRFFLQPKVGVNIATITNGGECNPRIGGVFGLELEYKPESFFGVSVGVNYSMQGDKASKNYQRIGMVKAVERIDYITFPVLGVMNIANSGVALKFGIQPAFNVLANISISSGGQSKTYSFKKLGITIDEMEFSIPFGISYTAPNGISIEARYNMGVSEVVNNTDLRNCVFSFTLGRKFEL